MSTSELSRRERKKEETRRRIFEAAMDLFRTRGFEATTVDDITERADVARGTFFNYFPRKESVLLYLTERQYELALERAELLEKTSRKSARRKLLEVLGVVSDELVADRALAGVAMQLQTQKAMHARNETAIQWQQLTEGLVRQCIEEGEFRRNLDVARTANVLRGVKILTMFMWSVCDGDVSFDLETEIRQRLELVLDGLVAR